MPLVIGCSCGTALQMDGRGLLAARLTHRLGTALVFDIVNHPLAEAEAVGTVAHQGLSLNLHK